MGQSAETGEQRSDAEGGHLWGYLIQPRPQEQQQESRPEAAKTGQGNPEQGPFGPAWNSPSTVFFLKRDAMVRDHSWVVRLGPVRSATGKGQEGKDRLLESSEGRSRRTGEEGGVYRQDPQRAAVSAKPTAAESPRAQVTVN